MPIGYYEHFLYFKTSYSGNESDSNWRQSIVADDVLGLLSGYFSDPGPKSLIQ